MDNIFKWISGHKKLCFWMMVGCIVLPIVTIHVLFKLKTNCYWIEADWTSGDILGYFGDVLAFLGTVVLGYVSLLLNEKAVKQNDKLINMQHNQEKAIAIFNQEEPLVLYTKNEDPILIKRLEKDGIDVNLDYIEDTYNTRDIMIMEVYLKNLTDNAITGLTIKSFDIIIGDNVIKPVSGIEEECSAFISERGTQKLKIILTGLKTVLSDEQWKSMKMEFDVCCVISSKNAFNDITNVKFGTGACVIEEKEKQGRLSYKIYNYDYEILESICSM